MNFQKKKFKFIGSSIDIILAASRDIDARQQHIGFDWQTADFKHATQFSV